MKRFVLFTAGLTLAAGFATVATAGELHANIFGDVYNGDSPFSVGQIESGAEGPLRVDRFGDVYVGNSPFSVGHLEDSTGEGVLKMDEFGDVRAGDSPFVIKDAARVLNLKR